ncbi:MAG: tetratricopeptide repeat protein, partial [Planctomycetota bacterium]
MSKKWLVAAGVAFIAFMAWGGSLPAAEHYESSITKGNTLLRKEMYQEALDAYEGAIQLKPDAFEAWYNKAVILDYLGKHSDAIASFEKAIQCKPGHYEAWYMKGMVLDHAGKYGEAVRAFDKALEIKPDYLKALHNKGNVLDHTG